MTNQVESMVKSKVEVIDREVKVEVIDDNSKVESTIAHQEVEWQPTED
jgi:hypothetical protein